MLPLNIYRKYWDSWESETIHFCPKHTYIVYYSLNKIFKGVFFISGPRYLATCRHFEADALPTRQCSVIEFYPKFYRNFVISSYGRFPCSSSSCINVIFIGYLLISTALIVCHCQIKCQCHCLSQTLVNSNVQSQCDLTLNEKNGSSDFFLYATIRNMFFHIVFNYFPHSPVHSFVRWGGWLRSLHLAVFP